MCHVLNILRISLIWIDINLLYPILYKQIVKMILKG